MIQYHRQVYARASTGLKIFRDMTSKLNILHAVSINQSRCYNIAKCLLKKYTYPDNKDDLYQIRQFVKKVYKQKQKSMVLYQFWTH